MLIISPTAKISKLADIEDSIRGTKIIIEDGVFIDSFVKVKPVGGTGDVLIKKNSYINSGVAIYSGNGIYIGENVLIAANCTLAPVNHQYQSRIQKIAEQGFRDSRGGITIEDDVWIGANSVILDGSILREGCVIGAHSLVNKEVDRYSVNVGIPLRQIGERK
ncbi:MAG: acyltransferase [Cyanosarcina radialis HA8281-LM2]|jgi:acetyltransferase-like isoleucine patch superfamily enzyme|nr:acyltransferase [Cyanosarcina radialis HA8281-LM2]